MQLITQNSQSTFKTCRKQFDFAYNRGIRPVTDAKALRMGTAYDEGQEAMQKGRTFPEAVAVVRANYAEMPERYEHREWAIECETVVRLLAGYVWRWSQDTMQIVSPQQIFRLALINPATGAASKTFQVAGKIDGIVRLEDRRFAVVESKLLGEDIGSDGQLWKRMRIDNQISLYVWAARQLGFPVESVIYDVTRKPTIAPTPIPILDGDGLKIVLDAHGERLRNKNGTWKQTADKDAGGIVQTVPMTPTEWGEKLIADIQERPDFYFVRNEITRLDQEIDDCLAEIWDVARTIREAQLSGRHYRTVTRNTCPWCPYFNLCTEGRDETNLPEGFEIVSNIHPELFLEGETHGIPTASAPQGAATHAPAGDGAAAGT